MFNVCLHQFLGILNDKYNNSEHTVMGEFNFNYANSNCSHIKAIKYLEKLFDIKQIIDLPIRSTRNSIHSIHQHK